jgi:hypothetical protein
MNMILDRLISPYNHGDVHISAMLRNPRLWRVRPELLHHVIKTSYRYVFSRSSSVHTMLVILNGFPGHMDGLVRVQNVLEECDGFAPLLIPRGTAPDGPYAIMGYGNLWRPLRVWYSKVVVKYFKIDRKGLSSKTFDYQRVSNQIQQYGANRDEQAVYMAKRTNALQIYDVAFDRQ